MTQPDSEQSKVQEPRPVRLKLARRLAGVTPNIDPSGRIVVFTHVPKTGGTTLDHIIGGAAAATRRQWRRLRMKSTSKGPRQERNQRLLDFEGIPQDELEGADYLTGHFQFGIHRRLQRSCLYVTLVRDPAKRLLSNLRFGMDHGKWRRDTSIDSIFEGGRLISNIQTRQLAGIADAQAPITAQTLVTALDNLRRYYAIVGVTERFDETLRALITLFGWPDVAYADWQVSHSQTDADLEDMARTAAARHFQYDMELFAYATSLPTPWRHGIMDGTPIGAAPQNQVVIVSPQFQINNRAPALMPTSVFDTTIRPSIERAGGSVALV